MKRYKGLALALGLGLTAGACDDSFLNTVPPDVVSDAVFWTQEKDAVLAQLASAIDVLVIDPEEGGVVSSTFMIKTPITISNKLGLHARASAKFVKLAALFDAEVRVSKDGQTVDARSIMGLMMLAASPGCCIEIQAEGDQAHEAIEALAALVAGKFDEGE